MLFGKRVHLLALLAALGTTAAASIACSGGTVIDQPQKQVEVVSQSGASVKAAISSASLGESYSGSNLQLAFVATTASNAAKITIKSVALVDMNKGTQVALLSSSEPRVWNGSSYVTWNESVTPGGDLRASYKLSTPNWSEIDGTGTGTGAVGRSSSSSYSIPFRLRVTMQIDGTEVILESSELHREPVAVT
ncbi:MAG: hypothetical protein JST00_31905 [Deltaproteobacteria bacterium]|nr:hypothetical protein [Deltaproteobacteria bacterium]